MRFLFLLALATSAQAAPYRWTAWDTLNRMTHGAFQILRPILGGGFPAAAGPNPATLIQTCSVNASSGGGASVSTACSITAGHTIVAFAVNIQSASLAPVISDGHNTYTNVFSAVNCPVTQFGTAGCELAYVLSSASGVTTISSSGSGFATISLIVREYSGVAGVLDTFTQGAGVAAANPITGTAFTTNATVEDLIVAVGTGGHTMGFGVGSGFSDFTSLPDTSASNLDIGIEDILKSNKNTAYTPQFTSTATNGGSISGVAFKLQ